MITLAFLKLLESEGFGTEDVDLFYQKLTLDEKGIYIVDIGDPVARGSRDKQSYELLARGKTDIDGKYALSQIRKYIIANGSTVCSLPAVTVMIDGEEVEIPEYINVELSKPSTITNVGLDDNNRVIYSITGTIIYKEK